MNIQSKLKIIGKYLIIVFLLPFIATLWLYPPTERIIFSGRDYQQTEFKIEELFQKKPTFRNLTADVFSVPLFLDWYKITIVNNSTEENPNCLEGNGNPPTVFFTFLKGDPRIYGSNLKETTFETGGYGGSGPGHPTYYLKSGDKSFFIAPSWIEYSINGGLMFGGDCNPGYSILSGDNFELSKFTFDYNISIKPYWVSWLVRFFIIVIFWIFLVSSGLSIHIWLRNNSEVIEKRKRENA